MFEGKLKWIRIWHGMKRRNILRHTKMNIENLSERRVKGRWNVMSSFFFKPRHGVVIKKVVILVITMSLTPLATALHILLFIFTFVQSEKM